MKTKSIIDEIAAAQKVKAKYPDAEYYEESKWWQSGVWRKGIVPIWLGRDWPDAAYRLERGDAKS